ncbi:MAG: hypothetical protein Q7K33_00285 [Candidatus Berkelbacteria bacterium]|nr:hypothetical protein [Candidatus Berkelbacteria bacterium]
MDANQRRLTGPPTLPTGAAVALAFVALLSTLVITHTEPWLTVVIALVGAYIVHRVTVPEVLKAQKEYALGLARAVAALRRPRKRLKSQPENKPLPTSTEESGIEIEDGEKNE